MGFAPWRWAARAVRYSWEMPRAKAPYVVGYEYHIHDGYFDPDSHCEFEHLCAKAVEEDARVWTGRLASNRVHIAR